MLTAPEFNKKQILWVFSNEGDKLSFHNDNLVVKEIIVDDCEKFLQNSIVINAIANTLIKIL